MSVKEYKMYVNTVGARKLLGFLYDSHAVKAPAAEDDYPYESSSSESEASDISEKGPPAAATAAKRAPKKKVVASADLPQPAPPTFTVRGMPAGAKVGAMPGGNLPPKEKKPRQPRAKKLTAATKVEPTVPAPELKVSEPAPSEPKGTPLPSAKADTKKKRAPSAYNAFVSKHMKAGKSMKEVSELWKAEKVTTKV